MQTASTVKRLIADKALLFVCDVQDKFAPKAYKPEGVIEAVGMMCEVARMFAIPTLITEQNPPVFGDTYPDFIKKLGQTPYTKTAKTYSISPTKNVLDDQQPNDGVPQTAPRPKASHTYGHGNSHMRASDFLRPCRIEYDLNDNEDYDVFLPVDCITSTRAMDRTAALNRIAHSGGVISTFESLTFELLKDYKHENFKMVLGILKGTKRENMISHL